MRGLTAVLVAVALAAGAADAALPPPPFDLAIRPARVTAGEPVVITLTPAPPGAAGEWDVYLVWAFGERAAFLGPDGVWSPRPVAFRARLAAGTPLTVTWTRPGPPGEIPLGLLVVTPGADPLERADWKFRPMIRALRVLEAGAPRPPERIVLGALACAALAAIALVLAARKPFFG